MRRCAGGGTLHQYAMRTLALAVPAFFALLLGAGNASAFSCDGNLISQGDSAARVAALCGDPLFVARRQARQVTRLAGLERRLVVPVEEWTYRRPGELLHVLVFQAGRLLALREATPPSSITTAGASCDGALFTDGDPSSLVALRCGMPLSVDRWYEESGSAGARRFVTVERWTYNPGPGRFLRVLLFADGRLVRDDAGGRGF